MKNSISHFSTTHMQYTCKITLPFLFFCHLCVGPFSYFKRFEFCGYSPNVRSCNQTQTESHPSRICWQTSFCACLSGSLPSSFASETSSSSVCVPVLLQRINITQWPSNPFAVSPLYIKHERDRANMQLLLNPSEAQMINQSKFILCIKK